MTECKHVRVCDQGVAQSREFGVTWNIQCAIVFLEHIAENWRKQHKQITYSYTLAYNSSLILKKNAMIIKVI